MAVGMDPNRTRPVLSCMRMALSGRLSPEGPYRFGDPDPQSVVGQQ